MHGAAAVRPVPEAVQFQRGLLSQPVLRGRRQEALSPAAAESAGAAGWRRTGTDVPAPGGFALGCLSTGTGLMGNKTRCCELCTNIFRVRFSASLCTTSLFRTH